MARQPPVRAGELWSAAAKHAKWSQTMSKQRVAVYPGVFDPVTFGHLDIIRRGAALFDRLIVAVADNPAKQSLFATDERLAMVREAVGSLKNVAVNGYEGLTVEYVRRHGASVILRGLRQHSDFEYEHQLALTNRTISGVETLFVMADERVAFISSHLVREVAALGGDVSPLVPPHVLKALRARLAKGAPRKPTARD
jgi:pantetheine-phosphate adenylyltransferase